jgi:NitT/TauT family transport system permease protein
LGIFIGYTIGVNAIASQLFSRLLQIRNSITSIAFSPIALILLKENNIAAIFVVLIRILSSVIVETATGIQKCCKQDNNVCVTIHFIFKALKIGLWTAWFKVIATEMLAGSKGLGFLI